MKKITCVMLLAFAFTLVPTVSEAAVTGVKHSKYSHTVHKTAKCAKKHIARHHSRTTKHRTA